MDTFKISSAGGTELEFGNSVPAGIVFDKLADSFVSYVHGPWGRMIFQQLELEGLAIWDSQYFLNSPVTLYGSADIPVYELHSAVKNHFTYSWDGIGQPTERQAQGGFSHTPFVNNKVVFEKGQYRTFDIHGKKNFLTPFANAYGKLYTVLDRAEKNAAGSIDRLFTIDGKLKVIIGQIRNPECAPDIRKRYYQIKAEEYIIHALHQMHADANAKPFTLTASLKEKAEQLEAILRNDVENPVTGGSLPSLPELAKKVSTNMEYIRLAFKDRYGTTIFEYHRRLRLEKAKVLLIEQPHLDQESIAIECGFYDSPRLVKAFKAAFHVTPGEFRKQVIFR